MARRNNEKKANTKGKYIQSNKKKTSNSKYIQSKLFLGGKKETLIKCAQCGMTYSNLSHNDISSHQKFHDIRLKGRKWSSKWGQEVSISTISVNTTPSLSQGNDQIEFNEKVVMIRPGYKMEVNATIDIMTMVNDELNAPHDENGFWSEEHENNGKAFVFVKNGRAVGALTMEILTKNRGRWMIYKNKEIVQNSRPQFVLGISRIWVCKSQRLRGIATTLLNTAREHTIFGKNVDRRYVAWSQPSDNGGKMAIRYNSVKHGSGEILIPCYI